MGWVSGVGRTLGLGGVVLVELLTDISEGYEIPTVISDIDNRILLALHHDWGLGFLHNGLDSDVGPGPH